LPALTVDIVIAGGISVRTAGISFGRRVPWEERGLRKWLMPFLEIGDKIGAQRAHCSSTAGEERKAERERGGAGGGRHSGKGKRM
jgi:hypothetical protein